jgi:hypothetical protein
MRQRLINCLISFALIATGAACESEESDLPASQPTPAMETSGPDARPSRPDGLSPPRPELPPHKRPPEDDEVEASRCRLHPGRGHVEEDAEGAAAAIDAVDPLDLAPAVPPGVVVAEGAEVQVRQQCP